MIKGQKIELKVNSYQRWVQAQNIPVIKEYYIQDLKTCLLYTSPSPRD